jgi:septal ring factor EnvC (AmiA/AmiB activator)
MNELIFFAGGVLVTVGGGLGYIKYKLLQQKNEFNSVMFKSEDRKKELIQKCNDTYRKNKELEAELEGYKQEYKATGNMYDELKKEFQQLADEHNKLKEKHAPFASLNPFEQQAVSAMTDQSVYNEWLNGAPKEGQK